MLMTIYCIYWTQYSFNFVVYALRNDQYRKAYYDFLLVIWNWAFYPNQQMLDDSVVLIVNKSILPPKLLEFYARLPNEIHPEKDLSKTTTSLHLEMIQSQDSYDSPNYKVSKFDSKIPALIENDTFTKSCNKITSPKINVKMDLPLSKSQQRSIVIDSSKGGHYGKCNRRNSDTKISDYINFGTQHINMDNSNRISKGGNSNHFKDLEKSLEIFGFERFEILGNITANKISHKDKNGNEKMKTILAFTNENGKTFILLNFISDMLDFPSSINLTRRLSV